MDATIAPPAGDGRHRRSEQSRDRIVAAVLALIEAGEITPSAEDVAARAQVGLRSVFRHFKDMETLYAEMTLQVARGYQSSLAPFESAEWRDQLFEAMGRRIAIYERLMPLKRAIDAHRHRSPTIQRSYDAAMAMLRTRLQMVVPAVLSNDVMVFETIDLLLSFDTWQRLRIEQKLPTATARSIIEAQITGLVDQDPAH